MNEIKLFEEVFVRLIIYIMSVVTVILIHVSFYHLRHFFAGYEVSHTHFGSSGFFDPCWSQFSHHPVSARSSQSVPTESELLVAADVCMSLRAAVAGYWGSDTGLENSQPFRELPVFAEW